MSANNDTNGDDDAMTAHDFDQTHPLRLTDYNGADHRGRVKLTFDQSTLPDDLDSTVADDLNWALRAVNAVVHHPNLALWVRTHDSDLVLAYHPLDGHERAGHLRAATFSRTHSVEGDLTTETETDCGLITPFDAMNVLYDYIVQASYHRDYSMVLADTMYLNECLPNFDHPVTKYRPGIESWGRHQLTTGSFPRPDTRARTAYPESAYRDTEYPDDEHAHAQDVLEQHIRAFELPGMPAE